MEPKRVIGLRDTPRCKAHRVELWRGKYEHRVPCKKDSFEGPYCEEHTPRCPVPDCGEKTWPTGAFMNVKWTFFHRRQPEMEGTMQVLCKNGHKESIPIPKELRPKPPKKARKTRPF